MSQVKTPLKKGDKGLDVRRVQTLLIALKFLDEKLPNGKPSLDGDFGNATEAAVKAFQTQATTLKPTGILDAETWKVLNPYRTVRVTAQVSSDFSLTMPPRGRFSLLPRLVPMLTLQPMDMTWHPTPGDVSTATTEKPAAAATTAQNAGRGFVLQPQLGPQYLTPPVFYTSPPGSTKPGQSLAHQLQVWLTYRTAKDGRHLELGVGPSFSVNQKFHSDDPRYTIAGNVSIMVADIFAKGSWHFLSPELQLGYYNNRDDHFNFVSSGLALNVGDQMSYEIIDDTLMFIWTPGFWMQYDLKTGQVQGAPGLSLAIGGSF